MLSRYRPIFGRSGDGQDGGGFVAASEIEGRVERRALNQDAQRQTFGRVLQLLHRVRHRRNIVRSVTGAGIFQRTRHGPTVGRRAGRSR